ncbi:hypothetical protein BDV96DRAFT_46722 [Lophiotrema nucula]|uniref:Uncharacterized protein n=1 Tax=Lophiotrema nucula TaxID=690887 RepID=A0A6A5ZAL1_9PLEO|nr:hypothetical protein BDV96DRAFT_46722 [Lophiotrema nucula]
MGPQRSERIENASQEQMNDESSPSSNAFSATVVGIPFVPPMDEVARHNPAFTPINNPHVPGLYGRLPPTPRASQDPDLHQISNNASNEIEELRRSLAFYQQRYSILKDQLLVPYARSKDLSVEERDIENVTRFAGLITKELRALREESRRNKSLGPRLKLPNYRRLLKPDPIGELMATYRALDQEIKKLARKLAEKCKVTLTERDDMRRWIMLHGVPFEYWERPDLVKYLVGATIWSALIDSVFQHPFACFGAHAALIPTACAPVFCYGQTEGWPEPTDQSEQFRILIVTTFLERIDRETIIGGNQPAGMTENPDNALGQSIIYARGQTTGVIKGALNQVFGKKAVKDEMIWPIVNKAFELGLVTIEQPFRLQLTFPHHGTLVEIVNVVPVKESDHGGNILIAVAPGVYQRGNEMGRLFEQQKDLILPQVYAEDAVAASNKRIMVRSPEDRYQV